MLSSAEAVSRLGMPMNGFKRDSFLLGQSLLGLNETSDLGQFIPNGLIHRAADNDSEPSPCRFCAVHEAA